MATQRNQIVKVQAVSSSEKTTSLGGYFVRNLEDMKTFMSSAKIRNKRIVPIIGAFIAFTVLFVIILGNLANNFHEKIYSFTGFSGNTALTVDYHRHAILSDYLKTMTQVILEQNPKQVKDNAGIFRAMTQATLQQLDPQRQRYVIMFLRDANLLQSSKKQASLLLGANLIGINLQNLNLRFADLQDTNLTGADLRGADLRGANLESVNLTNSCYNSQTIFDKRFKPIAAGMREIAKSKECPWSASH
ncbi:MAG: pentapeptide repeat-containing protein [Heteroscytonema crispum UTEX LB 1556]